MTTFFKGYLQEIEYIIRQMIKAHQIFFILKLRAVMLYVLQGQTVKADPTSKTV